MTMVVVLFFEYKFIYLFRVLVNCVGDGSIN